MSLPYVSFDDSNPYIGLGSSEVIENELNKFHIYLSTNSLTFTGSNQEKQILIQNIGWEKLSFKEIVFVGSGFEIVEDLPNLLLPDKSYPLTITCNLSAFGSYSAGAYIDVGNSYGNKFLLLTANIT